MTRQQLPLPPTSNWWPIIVISDIVGPITGLVDLSLAVTIAKPSKSVAPIFDVEVVPP